MSAVQPVSFLDALTSRYGADDDTATYDPAAFVVGGDSCAATTTTATTDSSNGNARKGKRAVKVWEFVGMDAVRAKQRRYDRLQHVQLRDMGVTVAVKPAERTRSSNKDKDDDKDDGHTREDALSRANLVCLQTLDLSANAQLPLAEVGKLLHYLPALETLQLCDIPTLLLPPPSTTTATTTRTASCYTACAAQTRATAATAPLPPPPPPLLRTTQLTKLVLNNTGFRVCAQLCALVAAPQLRELHLDSNALTSFDVYDDCRAGGGSCACGGDNDGNNDDKASACDAATTADVVQLPHVTTLSLAHNKLCSWGLQDDHDNNEKSEKHATQAQRCCCCCARAPRGLARTLRAVFPALTQLYVGHNALPNLTLPSSTTAATTATTATAEEGAELPSTYAFLRPLRALHINDNAGIDDTRTMDALRVLCPQLEALRVSYDTLLPTWNATLARMYVIAALPHLTLLNRGQVRDKERLDADVFYIQRGLAQQQQQQQQQQHGGDSNNMPVSYALLAELREKHKDLVLAIYREGDTASSVGAAHVMLTVTLQCENHYVSGNKTTATSAAAAAAVAGVAVTRTLPSSLTVGKLKALVRALFGIDVVHQDVRYRTSDASVLQPPTQLCDELQTLAYYGVSNGDTILVRDTSVRD